MDGFSRNVFIFCPLMMPALLRPLVFTVKRLGLKPRPASEIWSNFEDFISENHGKLRQQNFTDEEILGLDIWQLMHDMDEWLEHHC